MKPRTLLRPESQLKGINHIWQHKRVALFMAMGSGKTATVLTWILDALAQGEVKKVLIVCPKRIALNVWIPECNEWQHLQSLSNQFEQLCGVPRAKYVEVLSKSTKPIHIINVDNVTALLTTLGKRFDYDCICIDESSQFKDASSIRFKGKREDGKIKQVGMIHVASKAKYFILLTGTPAANSMLSMFSQIKLLDGGKRLGESMTAYKIRFFDSDFMGYNWTLKQGAQQQIENQIKDICLTITADNLGLPPVFVNDIYIDLPQNARKAYKELQNELITYIDGIELNPANAAVLRGKLQQIAQGFAYSEVELIKIHDEKLNALDEILEEESGNILLFYKFKRDEQVIKERFPFAVHINEPQAVERWNKGKIRLLIGNPASCGHGLNLQHGGNVMVYYALESSAELVLQANARLQRPGQKHTVIIHRIIARNTVDDLAIIPVLEGRITAQDALLNALKQ